MRIVNPLHMGLGLVAGLAAGSGLLPERAMAQATGVSASSVDQDATAVSDLVVRSASMRPQSDVPRFTEEQLGELRAYARENFSAALKNEGRGDRGLVTTHGPRQMAVNPRSDPSSKVGASMETPIQIMGVLGASEGRKRALYRQLDRASEEAEKATAAANDAFLTWMRNGADRDKVLETEKAREAAVRTLLEVREKTLEGADAADALGWARILALATEASERVGENGGGQPGNPQHGLPADDQERVFRSMEDREHRLAAEGAARNLKFEGVTARPVVVDGKVTGVRVSGLIRNTADVNSRIPPFNLVFYDERNQPFAGMLVQPDEAGVAANGSKRFSLDIGMSGDARISRVALVFGAPSFRPSPGARAAAE